MVRDFTTKQESTAYDLYGPDFRWELREKNRLLLIWHMRDKSRPYTIKLVHRYHFSGSIPRAWLILNMGVVTPNDISGKPVDDPQEIERLNVRLEELRARKIESVDN
jgi:hypothetical protein